MGQDASGGSLFRKMNDRKKWPEGYGLRILDEVDSTLNEAVRMVPGLAEPVWIMAHRQTAGRGRRGRSWVEPRGNLATTLVMAPEGAAGQVALRSFVAALALFDTCEAICGASGLALKWPNDVLLNGGKLAGILLESSGKPGGVGHLAIGIGVNLAKAPALGQVEGGALRPVSLLAETGVMVAPGDFLTGLAAAYAVREQVFVAQGFAPIRRDWLARAARLGEVITARAGNTTTRGRFETLDEAGNLVLMTAKGRTAIAAAEVLF
jgi:BirA family transcriptional regulator, biotin operon repressor / biotin---[acetyl-CoA-carboxylase] ligase